MSTYFTISGQIVYSNQAALSQAVAWLTEQGFLREQRFVGEDGQPFSEERSVFEQHLTLDIPLGLYRNLGRYLDATQLLAGAVGETEVLWTMTDGAFEGGVLTVDEAGELNEVTYDLEEWARSQGFPARPQPPESGNEDAYTTYGQQDCDWQAEVESAFHSG